MCLGILGFGCLIRTLRDPCLCGRGAVFFDAVSVYVPPRVLEVHEPSLTV